MRPQTRQWRKTGTKNAVTPRLMRAGPPKILDKTKVYKMIGAQERIAPLTPLCIDITW